MSRKALIENLKFFSGMFFSGFGTAGYIEHINRVRNSAERDELKTTLSKLETNVTTMNTKLDKIMDKNNDDNKSVLNETENDLIIPKNEGDILVSNTRESMERTTDAIIKIDGDKPETVERAINNVEDFFSKIEEIYKIFNSKSGGTNFISSIDEFYKFIETLTPLVHFAYFHLFGAIFILMCTLSIISILFGNSIIDYFKLEEKYPRIHRLFTIRKSISKYSMI